jgi:large subunit ribosomal protein L53
MTVGFKGGKELRLEVGRLGLTVGDVVEDVSRVGRGVSREESLKN